MPHSDLPITADRPFPPITAVTSRPGDNIVVIAESGGTESFRVWGFQVNTVVRRTEFVNDLTQITNGSDLALGFLGESGHEQQTNSPGDDRLRIADNNKETIQELGFRVAPDDVLVAIKNPTPDTPVIGVQDSTQATGGSFDIRDSSGNDIVQGGFGGVRSQWTDASGLPTTATAPKPDQGHIKIEEDPEDNHIRIGFENKTGEDIQPRVDVVGATYHVIPAEDQQLIQAMLDPAKKPTARPVVWGGLNNDESEGQPPSDWTEVEVEGSDVRSALGEQLRSNRGGR